MPVHAAVPASGDEVTIMARFEAALETMLGRRTVAIMQRPGSDTHLVAARPYPARHHPSHAEQTTASSILTVWRSDPDTLRSWRPSLYDEAGCVRSASFRRRAGRPAGRLGGDAQSPVVDLRPAQARLGAVIDALASAIGFRSPLAASNGGIYKELFPQRAQRCSISSCQSGESESVADLGHVAARQEVPGDLGWPRADSAPPAARGPSAAHST